MTCLLNLIPNSKYAVQYLTDMPRAMNISCIRLVISSLILKLKFGKLSRDISFRNLLEDDRKRRLINCCCH